MTSSMIYRGARAQDFPDILAMSERYYIHNLGEAERTHGYLSARFNELQVAAMAADPGIAVAVAGSRLLGFMCGAKLGDRRQPPIVQALMAQFDQAKYRGRTLRGWRSFVYGPVCIEREYRGGSILSGLFETLLDMVAGEFELGVAFVAHDNPASMRAHIEKLGMVSVGDFEFNNRDYAILAFSVPGRAA